MDTSHPRRARRWHILAAGTLGVAFAVLLAGVTFAFLNVNGTGTGSASTGTVALTLSAPATHTCTYNSLLPGDLTGSATCSLAVTYTGSISAYMSLTVAIRSKAGSGGQPLYDGSNANGLTFAISDGTNAFTVPTGPGTTGGSCPAGYTCWTAANDLVAWYAPASLAFTTSKAATWTVTPKFLKGVTNGYQGGSAALTLTAQAVQAPANPLPASCTTSTIGKPCAASGTFTWS